MSTVKRCHKNIKISKVAINRCSTECNKNSFLFDFYASQFRRCITKQVAAHRVRVVCETRRCSKQFDLTEGGLVSWIA